MSEQKGQMRCGTCGQRIVFPMTQEGEPIECDQCGALLRLVDQSTAPQAPAPAPVQYGQPVPVVLQRPVIPNGKDTIEPWAAGLLGMLILGLGQIVVGQAMRGISFMAGAFVLVFWLTAFLGVGGFLIAAVICFAMQCVLAIDADRVARKLHAGKPVGYWESGFRR